MSNEENKEIERVEEQVGQTGLDDLMEPEELDEPGQEPDEEQEQEKRLNLKVEIKTIEDNQKEICIEVAQEDVEDRFKRAYDELRKESRVPGFRPGRVPDVVLRAHFGKAVNKEIKGSLLIQSMQQAMEDENIEPIGEPVIKEEELERDKPFVYSLTMETLPGIELGEYRGLTAKKEIIPVTAEQVEREINYFREMQAVQSSVTDRPVQRGDYVLFTAAAKEEGAEEELLPVMELEAQGIPSGTHFAGTDFEERLIGLNLGEPTAFTIEFPADYELEMYAGKKVAFSVEIKEIKAKTLPDLNDEFAREFGDYESLEAMRADLLERLVEANSQQADYAVRDAVIKQAVDNARFEPPQKLVDRQLARIIGSEDPEKVEAGREANEERAVAAVKRMYVLREIAKKEKLEVTEELMDLEIATFAAQTGRPVADVRKEMEEHDLLDQIESNLRERLTIAFLMKHAEIDDPDKPASADDAAPAGEAGIEEPVETPTMEPEAVEDSGDDQEK
ncbi:trigger factor [bacterium]|nr:trigger factor [candidate division CSSED10-310 bacterium]